MISDPAVLLNTGEAQLPNHSVGPLRDQEGEKEGEKGDESNY
jgi:hypothetical protein